MYNIVSYCIYIKFSPLQAKNKPHEGLTKHAFILGPVHGCKHVL
jgi:hypothetical protein